MSTVISIEGPMNSGKSTFGLTIPGKKFIFDLERGSHRATWRFEQADYSVWKLPADEKPDVSTLLFGKGDRIRNKLSLMELLTTLYVEVLYQPTYSTVIFDTAKVFWDICTQSYLQEKQEAQLDQRLRALNTTLSNLDPNRLAQIESSIQWRERLMQMEYGVPNERFRKFIDLARGAGKNLVLVNHIRDEFDTNSVPTGRKVLDGWSKTLDFVDWGFRSNFEQAQLASNGSQAKAPVFKLTIIKSPLGAALVGLTLENPTYPDLVNLVRDMSGQSI